MSNEEIMTLVLRNAKECTEIPKSEILGMWEPFPEEQSEIDEILADFDL